MNYFNNDNYSGESFSNIILENEEIVGVSFEECNFLSCRFIGCTFKSCKFINCNFKKSDITGTKVTGSLFLAVKFEDSRAMSIDWTNASSTTSLNIQLDFFRTNINYSTFASLDLKSIKIIDCEAHEVDFADSILEKADFEGSDLKDSIFSNTNLKRANFVKAKNYLINPMINRVKDAKFSLPYAAILLKSFNVKIEDENGEELI